MPSMDEILAKMGAVSGRDYTSARWQERMRFLEAVAADAPQVLLRLQGDSLHAYLRIVEQYREEYLASHRAPTLTAGLQSRGTGVETPESYDPPMFTTAQLLSSDDPLEAELLQALLRWCQLCRLRANWIIDAGLETIQDAARFEDPPDRLTWVYLPPLHMRKIFRAIPITPPAVPKRSEEELSAYLKRSTKETKRWFREQGLDPQPWKRSGKDWHYQALTLRLVNKARYPTLAKRFQTDWRTVQAGVKTAAELLGFPVEDLEI